MSESRPVAVAAARALALWWALSLGGAILLHAMWAPSGEAPPVSGALAVVYYAVGLFEVPGLVFTPTVVGALSSASEMRERFASLGFSIAVGLVNGFCWACLVAIGRASVRRRRRELAGASADAAGGAPAVET